MGNGVYYTLAFARNERLRKIIERQMQQAAWQHQQTGASVNRVSPSDDHGQLERPADSGEIEGKENPRYVVTNLIAGRWQARQLYE